MHTVSKKELVSSTTHTLGIYSGCSIWGVKWIYEVLPCTLNCFNIKTDELLQQCMTMQNSWRHNIKLVKQISMVLSQVGFKSGLDPSFVCTIFFIYESELQSYQLPVSYFKEKTLTGREILFPPWNIISFLDLYCFLILLEKLETGKCKKQDTGWNE